MPPPETPKSENLLGKQALFLCTCTRLSAAAECSDPGNAVAHIALLANLLRAATQNTAHPYFMTPHEAIALLDLE